MGKSVDVVEQMWHNDGHSIVLRINRADLEILDIICPNQESGGGCMNIHQECAVRWFIGRYGMDCNGGVCPADRQIRICWTLIGDKNDYESAQLWFMPLNDEVFQAWLTSNT